MYVVIKVVLKNKLKQLDFPKEFYVTSSQWRNRPEAGADGHGKRNWTLNASLYVKINVVSSFIHDSC